MVQPDGVSWRDWVDARFLAHQLDVDTRFKSQQLALELAKRELDIRLGVMNNWRQERDKMTGTYMTTERYESCHGRLVDQIANLEKAQAVAEARGKVYATIVAAIISIIVGVVVHYMSAH